MARDVETTSRLRKEIDSGKAGDKTAFPDPAASPLGTDDEAGGSPPTADQVRLAARHELRQDGVDAPAVSDERARTITGEGPGLASANIRPVVIGLLAVLVIGAVAFAALL